MSSPQIFLSYVRENVDQVERLCTELRTAGFSVWWDQDISPGQNWKFEIRKAMHRSRIVVLCFSEEAVDRVRSGMYPEIRDAIKHYRERKPGTIYLIPVRLSECEIDPIEIDDTLTLDGLQRIDLFPEDNWDAGFATLKNALLEAFQPEKRTQNTTQSIKKRIGKQKPLSYLIFYALILLIASPLIRDTIDRSIQDASIQKNVYLKLEPDSIELNESGILARNFNFSITTTAKLPLERLYIELHPRGNSITFTDFAFTTVEGIMQDAIAIIEPLSDLEASFKRIEVEGFRNHQLIEGFVKLQSDATIPENALRIAVDSPDNHFVLHEESSSDFWYWLYAAVVIFLLLLNTVLFVLYLKRK